MSWRALRRLRYGIVLLVACLVADMATPLLPGAFRWDPSESIEAATGRVMAQAVAAPAPLITPPQRTWRLQRDDGRLRRAVDVERQSRRAVRSEPRLAYVAASDTASAPDDD